MSDGTIIASGKTLDTTELTRGDGTVVERERVVWGDDTVPGSLARVAGALGDGYGEVEERTARLVLESIDRKLDELIFILKVSFMR